VAAGDETEDGVEACSVANKSGVGEVALRKLHPRMKISVIIVQRSLALYMPKLDRFKIELFTRYYFRSHTPAIGAKDLAILRMIFPEAGHALHLGRDYAEVKLGAFGRSTFAKVIPMALNAVLINFSNFAHCKMKPGYAGSVLRACFQDCRVENGSCRMKFAH
jgi:hypothetical protein